MRGCKGRLRSRLSAKLLSMHCRRQETLSSIAKCHPEFQQASQHVSRRRCGFLFESASAIGMETETDTIHLSEQPNQRNIQ
jgi:hypothetical protein